MQVNPTIFKAYDIRGVVGQTIDEHFAEHLGRAFGSDALAEGQTAVAGETVLADFRIGDGARTYRTD